MLYFAYGSNMSAPRLQQRINKVDLVDIAKLTGYQLRFHKCGLDGSGKCDAYYTGSSRATVWGVLFQIKPSHKALLDNVEGLGQGYLDKTVNVISPKGLTYNAFMYYATSIDDSLCPYDWYKTHVLNGAKAASFPRAYIQALASVKAIDDPDKQRMQQELSIYTLHE